ncbi:MAG: ATP-binding protein, partial [Thermoanaerobaculia bacterium]
SAVYTNLPPRRYTFRVMAVNRGRPWSEAGTAAFRFERLPVFTETNTFYAACALLLLAAGGAVVRMRVHNLKKRERRLTERVAEQTAALLHANTQLTTAKEAAETTAGLNAELSLRKQTILNAAGEGIFGLDADGRTTFVNSFAARLLGWSIEDLVGRSLHALIHPAGSPAALATVNDCLLCSAVLEPSMRSHTEVFVLRAGKSIPVEYTTSAITMDDGKRNGVVITFRDIRERQQIERMKSEFVSTVSHELRTPLTSIRGALGLLRGGLLGTVPPKFQRMIDIAASNTDRLARLINDILDLERLDSGTIQYERRSLDTYDLMVQVSEMIQTVADQAGVALAVEPVHALINADADRITQILTNLIGNAVKFSGRGTVVMLTGSRDDESFTFHVSDHGRGIPAEKLDLIFERFQQVNSSDARDKGGTGLGLAICRSIARAHGGHVWAESVEDVGSVFRLRLPLLQEASPTESLAS